MSPFMPAVKDQSENLKASTFLGRIQEASNELRTWETNKNLKQAPHTLNSVKHSQEPQQANAAVNNLSMN